MPVTKEELEVKMIRILLPRAIRVAAQQENEDFAESSLEVEKQIRLEINLIENLPKVDK